jgi:hypothetical protein
MEQLFRVELTQHSWDFICSALAKYPFEQVYQLLENIGKQVEGQKPKKDD